MKIFLPNPTHGTLRWGAFPLLVVLMSLTTAANAVLPPDEVAFVIITSDELAPAFEPLAAFKADIGLSARVVTLGWIGDHVAPGVDGPATVRGFLQEAHVQWGTEYVLLGGNLEQVPTRWVLNGFYPANGGSLLPVDLYFACLDRDWDADGDGVYGEAYENVDDPGDDVDMQPELALGRAPVSTLAEAALFVEKTIAFHAQSGSIALPRALMVADVLFPFSWEPGVTVILDGADFAENLSAQLEVVDPPWQTDRYYANHTAYPGAVIATAAGVLEAMSSGGYRLVHHVAHTPGDSLDVGQEFVTGDQLDQLENAAPFFLSSFGSGGAAHDGSSAIVQALLAPGGGCAAGLGATNGAFPNATHDYHESFYRHTVDTPEARVGDALKAAFIDLIEHTALDYVNRWTHMTLILLGDPTLPLSATEIPVSSVGGDPEQNETPGPRLRARLSVAPNPFNPQVEIRSDLPSSGYVRLSVCDLRGREVRVLGNDRQEAGEVTWRWDGKDSRGRAVASGAYLIRLETAGRIVQETVTLVR